MQNLFKILEKYGIYVKSTRIDNDFTSCLDVELDIISNTDSLYGLLHKLSIIDKYGCYDEYPEHIKEAIDSYLLMKKLSES